MGTNEKTKLDDNSAAQSGGLRLFHWGFSLYSATLVLGFAAGLSGSSGSGLLADLGPGALAALGIAAIGAMAVAIRSHLPVARATNTTGLAFAAFVIFVVAAASKLVALACGTNPGVSGDVPAGPFFEQVGNMAVPAAVALFLAALSKAATAIAPRPAAQKAKTASRVSCALFIATALPPLVAPIASGDIVLTIVASGVLAVAVGGLTVAMLTVVPLAIRAFRTATHHEAAY